jgi:hypothetical protein
MSTAKKSSRERVRAHRAKMRAQGLKPVTLWLPDINSPEFKAQARRDAQLIRESEQAKEDQRFVDSFNEWI